MLIFFPQTCICHDLCFPFPYFLIQWAYLLDLFLLWFRFYFSVFCSLFSSSVYYVLPVISSVLLRQFPAPAPDPRFLPRCLPFSLISVPLSFFTLLAPCALYLADISDRIWRTGTVHVNIAGSESATASLPFGVQQGLILSPLLFSLYLLPLNSIHRKHGIFVHYYANDSTVYASKRERWPLI